MEIIFTVELMEKNGIANGIVQNNITLSEVLPVIKTLEQTVIKAENDSNNPTGKRLVITRSGDYYAVGVDGNGDIPIKVLALAGLGALLNLLDMEIANARQMVNTAVKDMKISTTPINPSLN